MSDQLVYRLADLVRVLNLSKTTIYELIQRRDFPSPVKLTARSVGWRAREVTAWLESRPHSKEWHPAQDSV
ncbi:AlpA family phage regulatory protein [Achromobacter sp. Bel]|uniref:helix-turn-helix transcriptional regulator n=1 Tax=Achromobacter sp. Bel TaxID=2727415 RepID=UPI00145CBCBE|nr:AlpA family phage regulatory protein [Achromobacter sp. Bel]NMK47404.1 AlpA family phage regulatory protein [Achromobacter sp. Bel]